MDTTDAQRELEEFRRQWRQEVENRKQQKLERQKHARVSLVTEEEVEQQTTTTTKIYGDRPPLTAEMQSMSLENENEEKNEPKTAMDYYIIAVDNERQGKLGQGKILIMIIMKIN